MFVVSCRGVLSVHVKVLIDQFVQIEAIVTGITDEFPQLRKHKTFVTFVACFTMFLGSLIYITNGGMYVLSMIDWYAGSISVILICIVEVVIVGWIYGVDEFVRDLEFMVKEKISFWWIYVRCRDPHLVLRDIKEFNTDRVIHPTAKHETKREETEGERSSGARLCVDARIVSSCIDSKNSSEYPILDHLELVQHGGRGVAPRLASVYEYGKY
uniref:Uncharacterized protein n=1 Tax=Timema monikensis TaxID=170555 RepID=A0A7R9EJG7_9NEOP|nr:unnamed protein product [Timema monikensis]